MMQAIQNFPSELDEDKKALMGAFSLVRPGDPGRAYLDACDFLACWLIGNGLSIKSQIQQTDARARNEDTPEYEAMALTVSDETSKELHEKTLELSRLEEIKKDASMFWEAFLKDEEPMVGDVIDVPRLVQDGTIVKMIMIGQNPDEVERAKEVFRIVSRPVMGSA